ncbi:MAG: hypothetical protein COA84_08855 [Robiginitomaculum sp.]|nr:MAG: hypothetical protein COA84_08855 [Robiginitomaculum sp.]
MTSEDQIRLSMIVACARNGVIGDQGKMPWHLPSELAHFKCATLGKPVLMGRKTWDSLFVKPLPGRDNLVLTRNNNFTADGAQGFDSFDAMLGQAKTLATACGANEVMIIGGAMLYALALPHADRIYLTQIHADIAGDTRFDMPGASQWHLTSSTEGINGPKDDYPYTIKVFDRR